LPSLEMSQPKKFVMGGESSSSGEQLTSIARIGLLVCFAKPKVVARHFSLAQQQR
jgi:hypothetical protein